MVLSISCVFIIDFLSFIRLTQDDSSFQGQPFIQNKIYKAYILQTKALTYSDIQNLSFLDIYQSWSQLQLDYNLNMDELKSFKVTPQQRQYFQHIQCFNFCVKDYKDNLLNKNEKNCLKSCFKKYRTAQTIFLDKLNETMEYLAINDPALRLKFEESHKKLNK